MTAAPPMDVLVWKDPPPARKPRRDWGRFARLLKVRPGCWALIAQDVSVAFWRKRLVELGCEVRTVSQPDKKSRGDVYARWPKDAS